MHCLSIEQYDKERINSLFVKTDFISLDFYKPAVNYFFEKKVLISFFDEPSTRTRFSFEAAMTHLGGKILSASNTSETSSIAKGETWKDTFRTLSQYGHIIVCRHSDPKWIYEAEKWAKIPVINAGNGADEHPTQALLDLYTIRQELGKLDNLTVMLCGDLEHSRTIHSLMPLLKMHNANIILVPASAERSGAWACTQRLDLDEKYIGDYANIKIVIPANYPTPAIEAFSLVVRYTWL